MANGILMLLVIPAVIAFIFGIWVFYSVVTDVSKRETSQFTVIGPDTIRMKVDPAE
jgi:heme O synthase-like polyprenyltransferase